MYMSEWYWVVKLRICSVQHWHELIAPQSYKMSLSQIWSIPFPLCVVCQDFGWTVMNHSADCIISAWSFLSDLCNIVLSTLQWLPAKPGGNHRLVLLWETGRCDLPVQSPHYCRINSLIVNWSTYWVVREREREKERARLVVSSRVTRA